MTSFVDLIASFQREVAIPGSFATAYPGMANSDIAAALADAFGAAQLDGFFATSVLDPVAGTVTPDLSPAGQALVVLYAGMRMIRAELRTFTNRRYKAGPTEYEVSRPTSVLTELLKDLTVRKDALLKAAQIGQSLDVVLDGFMPRAITPTSIAWGRAFNLWWLPTELPVMAPGW